MNAQVTNLSDTINDLSKQIQSMQSASAQPAGVPQEAAGVQSSASTPEGSAAVASANTYTDQQTAEALSSAKTYTDAQSTQTLNSAKAYTDQALAGYVTGDEFSQFKDQVNTRFNEQDKRIDNLGAMGAASSQMAINTAGLSGDNRVGVGAGTYNGQSAASVGFQHMFNDHKASISIGAAFGSGDTSGGVGAGFSW